MAQCCKVQPVACDLSAYKGQSTIRHRTAPYPRKLSAASRLVLACTLATAHMPPCPPLLQLCYAHPPLSTLVHQVR